MYMIIAIQGFCGEYATFNDFCQKNFGAEIEPLAYEVFGSKLEIIDGNTGWDYISRNSACITWETNIPAQSSIEYGTTDQFGNRTEKEDRFYYKHIQFLHGLESNTLYYYRLASVDERGNTINSETKSFKTKTGSGYIELPGSLGTAPYFLNTSSSTYILTQDITSDVTAINIMGSNITLDLNGHTITFNNSAHAVDPQADPSDFGHYGTQGTHGIRTAYSGTNAKIYNGKVVQGVGNGGGNIPTHQPLYGSHRFEEIAGLEITYSGPQNAGISSGNRVHHNIIIDTGTVIVNRHQGCDAIQNSNTVYNNLIKRCRHRGIEGIDNQEIYNNEMYIDSWATNSFGILYYAIKNSKAYNNLIFGSGYAVLGIGTISNGVKDISISSNFIHLQAVAPLDRSDEYGPQSSASCVRITWGGKDLTYEKNVLIANGRDGGFIRGIFHCPDERSIQSNIVFRKNIIKVNSQNDKSNNMGAVDICGPDNVVDPYPVVIEDNIIASNFCNVRLGEPYGDGNKAIFLRNTFKKIGNNPQYRTVQCGYWNRDHAGTEFIDSKLEDGASLDKVLWQGTGKNRNYYVKWTLRVHAGPNIPITIYDSKNNEVFKGNTGNQPFGSAQLTQFLYEPSGTKSYTPHKIVAQNGDTYSTKTITMDGPQSISFFNVPIDAKKNSITEKYETFNVHGNNISIPVDCLHDKTEMKVYNLQGKMVFQETIDSRKRLQIVLNSHAFTSGIYYLTLHNFSNTFSLKLHFNK